MYCFSLYLKSASQVSWSHVNLEAVLSRQSLNEPGFRSHTMLGLGLISDFATHLEIIKTWKDKAKNGLNFSTPHLLICKMRILGLLEAYCFKWDNIQRQRHWDLIWTEGLVLARQVLIESVVSIKPRG
jgi:hypothetical protein